MSSPALHARTATEGRQLSFGKAALFIVWPAFALICGFLLWVLQFELAQPAFINARLYPPSMRQLPEFHLIDFNSQPFTRATLLEKWSLLFFGYSYCPDVCPQTLMQLQTLATALHQERPVLPLQLVFVSIDPQRDKPEKLKHYLNYFDPDFVGVNAQAPDLDVLTTAIGVSYKQISSGVGSANYLMTHSAEVFVVNPQAELYAVLQAPHRAGDMAADLRTIFAHFHARVAAP